MNYPEDFINKVICGDCLEVMKQIPEMKKHMGIILIGGGQILMLQVAIIGKREKEK